VSIEDASTKTVERLPEDYGDRQAPVCTDTIPVTLILDNLRSAFNTGNIFRVADAVKVERIIGCGYTPLPPHEKLHKTARGCENTVKTEHCPDVTNAVDQCRQEGYTIYAVETGEKSKTVWDVPLDFPAAFVCGNEALGISEDGLEKCDYVINIPCMGYKYSINVGNCVAVTVYESLRQWRLYDRI